MKAYGDRGYWETEDYGPPSKMGKLSSKNRKESRRMLHKQGRIDGKEEICRELIDSQILVVVQVMIGPN